MILRLLLGALQLGLEVPLLVFLSLALDFVRLPPAARREGLVFSACFASLFAFMYLLNRTTDRVEDAANASLSAVPEGAQGAIRLAAWTCLLVPALWLSARGLAAALGVYAFAGFFGYAYSRPVPPLLPRRLKDVFLVKNLTVAALGWAPTLVYAPMAYAGRLAPGHLVSYARVSMLIFAISATWDVRDMAGDALAGVRTLPLAIGVPATKALGLALVAGYAALTPEIPLPFAAALAATAAWIALAREDRGRFYFHWGLLFWAAAETWLLLAALASPA